MKNIVAIVGPSAAGKDTVLKVLEKTLLDYNFVIHATTRPQRSNETNGIEYNFLTHEEMYNKIINNEIFYATTYDDETYAIENNQLKDGFNIGVFSLDDLEELYAYMNIYIIYITANSKIRFIRSLQREEKPDINKIYRRYLKDDEDFYWFEKDLENKYKNHYITIDTSNDIIDYDKIFNFIKKAEKENDRI